MPGTVVGLYCAVGRAVRPLGIDVHGCRMRNAGGLQPTDEEPEHMVGRAEPWFSGGLLAAFAARAMGVPHSRGRCLTQRRTASSKSFTLARAEFRALDGQSLSTSWPEWEFSGGSALNQDGKGPPARRASRGIPSRWRVSTNNKSAGLLLRLCGAGHPAEPDDFSTFEHVDGGALGRSDFRLSSPIPITTLHSHHKQPSLCDDEVH